MSLTYTPAGKNAFILNDGLDVVVALHENRKVTNIKIAESMAKEIYKAVTCFDVVKVQKLNYANKAISQIFVINDDAADLDSVSTATLDLNRTARLDAATLFVSSSAGAGAITGEALTTLIKVLKDAGAEPDPTYGKFKDIKLVIELPDPRTMEDDVVYLLTVNNRGYEAFAALIVSTDEDGNLVRNVFDTETGELTPIAYGDPLDANTYPVKEATELTKNVGSADSPVVEVTNRDISGTVAVTAGSDVNLVHNELNDGVIKITVA